MSVVQNLINLYNISCSHYNILKQAKEIKLTISITLRPYFDA